MWHLKMLSKLLHHADMKLLKSILHSTHCIHQLLPTLKFMPMKLRTSHCAFALPYCHYNLYKHSFVLQCIFDGAYYLLELLLGLLFIVIHFFSCISFLFEYFSR